MILPYVIIGTTLVLFLPTKLNILMLGGDEIATGLGLNVEKKLDLYL